MAIQVIGLGAGGHAKMLIEMLQVNEDYNLIGLLDINENLYGSTLLGVPILGNDDKLPGLFQQGVTHFFIGLGSVGNLRPRRKLYEFACAHHLKPINIIHSTAFISSSSQTGVGLTLMPLAVINSMAQIGENVLINTGAIVEHDCQLQHHIHVATGAKLASTVKIEDNVHIGAGAVIKQCVTIGHDSIVGAGAVVIKDVPPQVTVAGVPAKIIQHRG